MWGLESALAIAPLVIEAGELSEKICGILAAEKKFDAVKKIGGSSEMV